MFVVPNSKNFIELSSKKPNQKRSQQRQTMSNKTPNELNGAKIINRARELLADLLKDFASINTTDKTSMVIEQRARVIASIAFERFCREGQTTEMAEVCKKIADSLYDRITEKAQAINKPNRQLN